MRPTVADLVKFLLPHSPAMRGVTRSSPRPPSPRGAGPGLPELRQVPPPSLGPNPHPPSGALTRGCRVLSPSVRASPRHAAPHRAGEAGLRGSAPGPPRLYRAAAPIPPRHVRPAAPAPPAGVPAGPPTPGAPRPGGQSWSQKVGSPHAWH